MIIANFSFISRYGSQTWPSCLIRTKILTFANEMSSGVFTTPGSTSSSNSDNCGILLFSERPVGSRKWIV